MDELTTPAGFQRRELYIDARDLQSDSDPDHPMSPADYAAALASRGLEKLAEYEKVETVNSDVDPDANLVYMTGPAVTVFEGEIELPAGIHQQGGRVYV